MDSRTLEFLLNSKIWVKVADEGSKVPDDLVPF